MRRVRPPQPTPDERRRLINASFRRLFPSMTRDMSFTDEEANYISNPADSADRNAALRSLPVTHICDAYACVGGDAVQFTYLRPQARVDAVQIADTQDNQDRFSRLVDNVYACCYEDAWVTMYHMPISEYISGGMCDQVDFLYMDPPWMRGPRVWFTPDELIANLARDVAMPLLARGHLAPMPRYLCFKVSWRLDEPQYAEALAALFGREYSVMQSMTYGRSHSIHILERHN